MTPRERALARGWRRHEGSDHLPPLWAGPDGDYIRVTYGARGWSAVTDQDILLGTGRSFETEDEALAYALEEE